MNLEPHNNAADSGPERRVDGPVEAIDEGVILASVDGVGPAIEHMESAGVERLTALRVLTGPEYHREPGAGAVTKVRKFLLKHFGRKSP